MLMVKLMWVVCQKQKTNPNKRKKRRPLDRYVTSTALDIMKGKKEMKSVFGVCDKELRDKVCKGKTRWFDDAGIPFNVFTYPCIR